MSRKKSNRKNNKIKWFIIKSNAFHFKINCINSWSYCKTSQWGTISFCIKNLKKHTSPTKSKLDCINWIFHISFTETYTQVISLYAVYLKKKLKVSLSSNFAKKLNIMKIHLNFIKSDVNWTQCVEINIMLFFNKYDGKFNSKIQTFSLFKFTFTMKPLPVIIFSRLMNINNINDLNFCNISDIMYI